MKKKSESVNALIGFSGFVGSTLLPEIKRKTKQLKLYNSENIDKIKGKRFNEVFFAGLPAAKWSINKNPEIDKNNIKKIKNNLKQIECEIFILISTIDIHNDHETYGQNRKNFEKFIIKNFKKYLIIRLPGIFGKGLKKNILYDLLNKNNIDQININSEFQWFDLKLLYKEIELCKKKINTIYELYSQPIKNSEILKLFPNIKIKQNKTKEIKYNIKPQKGFYKTKIFMKNQIKKFIKNYEQ